MNQPVRFGQVRRVCLPPGKYRGSKGEGLIVYHPNKFPEEKWEGHWHNPKNRIIILEVDPNERDMLARRVRVENDNQYVTYLHVNWLETCTEVIDG